MKSYAERITDEYNKYAAMYEAARAKDGAEKIVDESVAAFMCNAIVAAVGRSSHKEVKEYFRANAVA